MSKALPDSLHPGSRKTGLAPHSECLRPAASPVWTAAVVISGLALLCSNPSAGRAQGGVQPTANYKYRLIAPVCEVTHLNSSYSVAVNLAYKTKLLGENVNTAAATAQTAAGDADDSLQVPSSVPSPAVPAAAAVDPIAAKKNIAAARAQTAAAFNLAVQVSNAAAQAYASANQAESEDKARIGAETEKKSEDVIQYVANRDSAFTDALKSASDTIDSATRIKDALILALKYESDGAAQLGASSASLDAVGPGQDAGTGQQDEARQAVLAKIALLQSAIEDAEAYSDALLESATAQSKALQAVRPFCLSKGATIRFEFDADNTWILFVEEGTEFEEGTGFGRELSRMGLDLSKVGINLLKDKVVSGRVVTVSKKNLNSYDIERLENDGWGTFIVPFKVRDTGKDTRFLPGGVFGEYYGLQLGSLVYFAGLGITPVSFSDPKDATPQTRIGISPVVGVINIISLSRDWQIGAVLGWDYLGSNALPGWKGEGEPWVGMIIGTTVLTQTKRIAKVNGE